ncbi:hypothetical protein C8J56DRAFT_884249 [Mycena floridula]|nr:hypothetical protein C8J56DRAFT_884249 [Mycena floridula]
MQAQLIGDPTCPSYNGTDYYIKSQDIAVIHDRLSASSTINAQIWEQVSLPERYNGVHANYLSGAAKIKSERSGWLRLVLASTIASKYNVYKLFVEKPVPTLIAPAVLEDSMVELARPEVDDQQSLDLLVAPPEVENMSLEEIRYTRSADQIIVSSSDEIAGP